MVGGERKGGREGRKAGKRGREGEEGRWVSGWQYGNMARQYGSEQPVVQAYDNSLSHEL